MFDIIMTYQRFYTLQFVRLWCNDIDNRLILDKYLADYGPMSSRNHLHHNRIVMVTKCQPDKLYRPYFDTDTRFGRLVMVRGRTSDSDANKWYLCSLVFSLSGRQSISSKAYGVGRQNSELICWGKSLCRIIGCCWNWGDPLNWWR